MAIAQQISADFGRRTKERGEEYFREGRVTITDAEPHHIAARVRGSATYKVDVYLGDEPADWEFECSCPVADEWGGPCKHIWATLLQAERQGIFGAASHAGGANGDS